MKHDNRKPLLHKPLGGLYRTYGVSAIRISPNGVGKRLGNSGPAHHNLDGKVSFLHDFYGVFHEKK